MAKVEPKMNNFANAYAKHQLLLAEDKNFQPVYRGDGGVAVGNSFYNDSQRGIQIRPPFDRKNYEFYRPGERIPVGATQDELREIMVMCNSAYERVGVIKSVVDMMSEFGAEGVEILHEEEGPNKFYQAWSKRIKLEDRVERALSWLYKSGQFVMRRKFGQLDSTEIRRMRRTDTASAAKIGRIPLEYTLYDPSTIELVGGPIGAVSDKKVYALRIPMSAFYNLRPKNDLEKKVYDSLPPEIKDAIELKKVTGYYYVPIDEDKIFVGYYKKDDSQIWAKSFIYSILTDVFYNEKVKQAKVSAMDGIINVIRLWKLGDHKEQLLPSPAAGAKLANILGNHTGGGAVDIIWTSDIQLEEFYPPIENLSGFEENTDGILLGLGIGADLVGGEAGGSGTNPGFRLKNMVKRLEAGRRVIREWLESEIDIIQENMGFRKRPVIRFANSDLYDERTYFTLLKDLVDRNILPDDRVLEIIGELPDYEKQRMQKQESDREKGDRPKKAGPFYAPLAEQQQQHELKKIKLQNELKPVPAGPGGSPIKKKPRKSVNGRPPGSRDKVTRKRSPNRARADLLMHATQVYDHIDQFVNSVVLPEFGKADIRLLTADEKASLEASKMYLLPRVSPYETLDNSLLVASYTNNKAPVSEFETIYTDLLSEVASDKITVEQKRLLKIAAYIEAWSEDLTDDEE